MFLPVLLSQAGGGDNRITPLFIQKTHYLMIEKIREAIEKHKSLLSDQEAYSFVPTAYPPFIFSTNIKFLNAILIEFPGSYITEYDNGPGWFLNLVINKGPE
jgi:hypothetical protein